MTNILISACLIGHKVRHDGKDKFQSNDRLQQWMNLGKVISICPEVAGGLTTPRLPAEIKPGHSALDVLKGQGSVLTTHNDDVTREYIKGAHYALDLAQKLNVRVAILKARSPSCGTKQVYDGHHDRQLIPGMGVTAALLSQHGIHVFDENEIDSALDFAETLD